MRLPQVVDVIGNIFTSIFEGLNANYQNEIETITKQYPVEPFKWLNPPLRLEYPEGVQMLKDVSEQGLINGSKSKCCLRAVSPS